MVMLHPDISPFVCVFVHVHMCVCVCVCEYVIIEHACP